MDVAMNLSDWNPDLMMRAWTDLPNGMAEREEQDFMAEMKADCVGAQAWVRD